MAHLGGDYHVLFGKGPAVAVRFVTGVNGDTETYHADLKVVTTKFSCS